MKYLVWLIPILLVGLMPSFAQESFISIQTDDHHYNEGDTIVISGSVSLNLDISKVTIQLFTEGNLFDIAQITVVQDGSYSHTVITEGPFWNKHGDYLVRVSDKEGNIAESEFSFTPKSEAIETRGNYEVIIDKQKNFDISYSIKGAIIQKISTDTDFISLIVEINSQDEGTITLNIPREFFGAEKFDGDDDTFVVLIDGREIPYREISSNNKLRVISFEFEQGDLDIEIIGTYLGDTKNEVITPEIDYNSWVSVEDIPIVNDYDPDVEIQRLTEENRKLREENASLKMIIMEQIKTILDELNKIKQNKVYEPEVNSSSPQIHS